MFHSNKKQSNKLAVICGNYSVVQVNNLIKIYSLISHEITRKVHIQNILDQL